MMCTRFSARRAAYALSAIIVCLSIASVAGGTVLAQQDGKAEVDPSYTTTFNSEHCRWSPIGQNAFFSLAPGTKHVLEGEEEGDTIRTVIEVTHKTQRVGDVHTRVIDERHYINGEIDEISHNYYAICSDSNSVFYFGEDVDYYENGEVIGHEGAWLDEVNGARFGLYMPSLPLLGARYHQEIAPNDEALDRAEVTSLTASIDVPAGSYQGCLETLETTPFEPNVESVKVYCPGVGIVDDDGLLLIEYRSGSLGLWPGFRR